MFTFKSFITLAIVGLLGSTVQADSMNVNNWHTLSNALSLTYMSNVFISCHLENNQPIRRFNCSDNVAQTRTFNLSDFQAAGYNETVYDAFLVITGQLNQQFDILYDAIEDDRFKTRSACKHSFVDVDTVEEFLTVGRQIFKNIVLFWTNSTSSMSGASYQAAAQLFGTTQARFAAYHELLLNTPMWPADGFEGKSSTLESIQAFVTPFLRECNVSNYFFDQTIRPYGVAGGPNGQTIQTGRYAVIGNSTYTEANRTSDIFAMNFLLFLETLQEQFFLNASEQISVAKLNAAGYNGNKIFPQLMTTVTVNAAHVEELRNRIIAHGGDPTKYCNYNFSEYLQSTDSALQTLWSVNSLATAGYIAAAGMIIDTNLQHIFSTMANVETRINVLLSLFLDGYTGNGFDGEHGNSLLFGSTTGTFDASRYTSAMDVGLLLSCPDFVMPRSSSSSTGPVWMSSSSSSSTSTPSSSSSSSTGRVSSSTGPTTTDPNSANSQSVSLIVIFAIVSFVSFLM